jgi:hypothetical protein
MTVEYTKGSVTIGEADLSLTLNPRESVINNQVKINVDGIGYTNNGTVILSGVEGIADHANFSITDAYDEPITNGE